MLKKISLILVLAAILFSCAVKLVPTYDPAVVSQVGAASNATNDLYDKIIASSDKRFDTYQSEFVTILNQIQAIKTANAVRDHNRVIMKIITDIETRFTNHIAEYAQAVTFNDAQLSSLKNSMHALWSALYNTESHFKH